MEFAKGRGDQETNTNDCVYVDCMGTLHAL